MRWIVERFDEPNVWIVERLNGQQEEGTGFLKCGWVTRLGPAPGIPRSRIIDYHPHVTLTRAFSLIFPENQFLAFQLLASPTELLLVGEPCKCPPA